MPTTFANTRYHATSTVRVSRHVCRWLFISVLLLVSSVKVHADGAAYSGIHEGKAARGTLALLHVHNWDSPKIGPLFSDLTHHERFFSAANDFAFVELRDGNKLLFRSPSPALDQLWISPDGKFVVGLSSVKLRNPYQLVVWQRDGTLVHCEHISAEVAKFTPEQRREFATRFPKAEQFLSKRYFTHGDSDCVDYAILGVINEIGKASWEYLYSHNVSHPYSDDFSESVTNAVWWFHAEKPDPIVVSKGDNLALLLRSPSGKRMTIPLKR